jgi:hypothetical protein
MHFAAQSGSIASWHNSCMYSLPVISYSQLSQCRRVGLPPQCGMLAAGCCKICMLAAACRDMSMRCTIKVPQQLLAVSACCQAIGPARLV